MTEGLKPFWRYYGAKWRAAPRYPKPRCDTIIEPFAGAAGYSLRYPERRVVLVEKYGVIAEIWRYLIGVSSAEVRRIPLVDAVEALPPWVPQGGRWLVGFHMNAATTAPCRVLSAGLRRNRANNVSAYEGWTEGTRARVAAQVERIRHWRIIEGDYTTAPSITATWFIDPPYQKAGRHYRHASDSIDFAHLGGWCRARTGQVIVCENSGADWLPFRFLAAVKSMPNARRDGGAYSAEAIWTNDMEDSMRTCGNCCERTAVGVWLRSDGAQVPVCAECGDALRAADRGDHGAKLRAQRAADGAGGAQSRTEDRLLITAEQDKIAARQDLTTGLRERKPALTLEGIMAKTKKPSAVKSSARSNADLGNGQQPHGPTTPKVFVTAVRGNLNGGIACMLGPRTLIVGDNATGKSTLLRAVELALSGAVSDVAGRNLISREADLMALAPGRTGTLFAEAQLSTGERVGYTCSDVAGSKRGAFLAPLPGVVDPARVFPLRAVREAIMGSADTARRFFMQHAVGRVSVPEVVARLPATLQADAAKYGLQVEPPETQSTDGVTALTLALETVEERLRAARSESKGADKVVSATGEGLAPEPTDAEIAAAETAVAAAQQQLTAVAQAATFDADSARRSENVAEWHRLNQERESVRLQRKAAQSSVVQLDPEATQAARGLLAAVEWAGRNGLDNCVCCNQPGALARYPHTAAAVNGLLANAGTASAQALANRELELSNRMSVLETLVNDLDRRLTQAAGAPAGVTLQSANEAMAAANARVSAAKALKAQHTAVRAARTAGVEAQKEVVTLTALRDALKIVSRDLLDGSVLAFEKRVQRYLPVTDRFFLRLKEGAREVCQFGLIDEGVAGGDGARTALSGAEWARVTIALAAAVSEGNDGALTILIPEDRAMTPATLDAVMVALGRAPQQVLIAHPTWSGKLPPGWTVIDCDANQHRAFVAEWGTTPPAPSTAPVLSVVR